MRTAVIDGNDRDRRTAVEVLEAIGEEYSPPGTASDGKAGYELILRERPDLVIMDIDLPKLSGLSMLKRLRTENVNTKVIILTEDRDFDRARKAIGLGVDNYLLKPVKRAQLKKAVLQTAAKIRDERALEHTFTVDNIFTGCMSGQLKADREFHRMTKEKYGFTLEEPGELFTVWLGGSYAEYGEEVRRILEYAGKENGISLCVIEADIWRMIGAVIYRPTGTQEEYRVFAERVVPLLCGRLRGEVICLWDRMERMDALMETLKKLRNLREWNLVFDRGDLIRPDDIAKLKVEPLKYPMELENRVREEIAAKKGEAIKGSYYRLYDLLRHEIYSPKQIRECLIRFNLSVLDEYRKVNIIGSELRIQHCLGEIARAVSWNRIRAAMEEYFSLLQWEAFGEQGDEDLSALIRRAVRLVRKYYDHGITLEEAADRLFVSPEYLSTQFKKETGAGFKETVTCYRIERIKDLLRNSRLKLNQIAELTGYSDPKYMSRVFKEEVGVLPNEYRKSGH